MRKKRLKSLEDTRALGKELARGAPHIIAIYGDLGAGKTTLAKSIASALGIPEEEVHSPTYTYMHHYEGLVHFDLWRLKNAEEFCALGFEEYLFTPFWVIIEWPERIEALLPEGVTRVYLQEEDGVRVATI